MEFADLAWRALEVRKQYRELETAKYGHPWTREDIALGLVGDVGDLCKLVMAKSGIRTMRDAEERIAHELADCFWSIIVLADMYGVDIERAFLSTMDDLQRHIREGLSEPGMASGGETVD
jgi:NTP pyrophosphatase (non-canonical NTP hydrolase)